MQLALFNPNGLLFLLRWLHFFFGIMWIGHLYYFNVTQGPFFAETDASTKSAATQKLVPRAMWWFRWGAMWTMVTGILQLGIYGHLNGPDVFVSSWGVSILLGMTLGLVMWANVWFVIWPRQKLIIRSAQQVAGGGQAIPDIAAMGARSGVASRTNTLLSIPLLFFMGAASHLPLAVNPGANLWILAAVLAVVVIIIEGNALKGKPGPMTTVKGVITSGFVLTAIFYAIVEILTK